MVDNREQVEQIRDRVDILEVVQRYVKLKQAGRNFVGLCPFHSEKTPSFSVNQELQIFKCFGCGKGGDVFAFMQEIEKVDFPEALERLAKEAGVELQKSAGSRKYTHLEEINEIGRRYFIHSLKGNSPVNKYLKERGITEESLSKFSIGYAPGDGSFLNYLKKNRSYTKEQLLASGLFTEKNGTIKEKFRKRVMFPILSSRGKTIAFSGRILPNNKYGPKYLNSPETPIFSKRMGVYGIYEARQAIRKDDLCIICEGQTDVISAHQIGIENIVAPLGTGLTAEQLQQLTKYTKNILFLFDNDEAGQRALERAFAISSRMQINAFASSPEPYADFDEMIRKDPKEAKSRVKAKTDAFSYLLSNAVEGKNLSDYSTYTRIVSYVTRLLENVKDNTMLDFYIKKTRGIADIDLDQKVRLRPTVEKKSSESAQGEDAMSTEHYYLKALLASDPIKVPEKHAFEHFKNNKVKAILEKIRAEKNEDVQAVAAGLEPELTALIESVMVHPANIQAEELNGLYERIARKSIEEQIGALRTQLAAAEEKREKKEVDRLFDMIQKATDKLREVKK